MHLRFLVPLVFIAAAPAQDSIILGLPVACAIGQTCFIQQYFDHDPGPSAKDYRCGSQSYDGHDGVDIRLPTLAAQRRGVNVLAAAPGTVKGLRDGVADVDVRIAGTASVKGHECGNGVVVAHEGGWETQYCHMAKGSVRVHAGDPVIMGTVLGLVGESGDAAFPHLHFSLRRNGQKLDPFAWNAAACGVGQSLWSPKAQAALAYRVPQVINAGFAPAPVTMDDVESGRAEADKPASQGAALIAFVRTIGLSAGDVQAIAVLSPNGLLLASSRAAPLDHDKAQWMMFAGKKNAGAGFAPGTYKARYTVERAGHVVLERNFAQQVR